MDSLKQKQLIRWLKESNLNNIKDDEESYSTKIPVFGYFLKKLRKSTRELK